MNNRFNIPFQKLLSIPGVSHSWSRWLFSPVKPYTLGKKRRMNSEKCGSMIYCLHCSIKSFRSFKTWWICGKNFSSFPFSPLFRSTTCNFYVVFPFILNSITLAGLYYLPKKMRLWDAHLPDIEDENSELLKKMGNFKKRRLQSKQKSN